GLEGSMTRSEAPPAWKAVVFCQVTPPSVDLYTPPPNAPPCRTATYIVLIFVGSTAMAPRLLRKPSKKLFPKSCQLRPPLVDLSTPAPVPETTPRMGRGAS